MDKRGISAVVATVLIILITVVAMTIIWAVIIPLINDNLGFQDPNARLYVSTSGGYTFYKDGCLYVQVKRGNDDANMAGFEIILTTNGNSETYKYGPLYVPAPNQAIVIKIWVIPKPDYVTIVPIFLEGDSLKRGAESSKVEIDDGTATDVGGDCLKTPMACEADKDCYNGEICKDGVCGCVDGEVVYQGGCAKEISCGFDEWESGKTYLLGSDQVVSETCFNITQNNIVLDGNGKTITGTESSGSSTGVYAEGRSGLTITNFKNISGFDGGWHRAAVYLESTTDSRVQNLEGSVNTYGVLLISSSNNILSNLVVRNSSNTGIRLDSSSNNTLFNIVAERNYFDGLFLFDSDNNQLTDITASFGCGRGITILSSSGNIVTNLISNSNKYYGTYVFDSSNNTLSEITSNSNLLHGVFLYYGSNNTFSSITANSNSWRGIAINTSSDNTFSSITANSNSLGGISLDSSSSNNHLASSNLCNNPPLTNDKNVVCGSLFFSDGGSNTCPLAEGSLCGITCTTIC
ncbi:MAG: right-handed parallel beta-helix repeat-containing protein [Nanoarchaeota archaeon]|nr:right-handed parallel beta-helix repeat-containing protein [Nanoarchaeota archaeon]